MKTWFGALLATLTATAMLATTASASPLPGFHLVGQSEHFLFYAQSARKAEAKATEKFLVKTAGVLGVEPNRQTAYYMYDFPDQIAATTGVNTTGLTELTTGAIHSTRPFHPHELVHRLAAELGDPGVLFHEGLAVSLGDEGKQGGVAVDTQARTALGRYKLREAADNFLRIDPRAAYAIAGSFVGYLIRQHGTETVARFFRGCQPATAARDRHFSEVFGQSLDEAGAAWTLELHAA